MQCKKHILGQLFETPKCYGTARVSAVSIQTVPDCLFMIPVVIHRTGTYKSFLERMHNLYVFLESAQYSREDVLSLALHIIQDA